MGEVVVMVTTSYPRFPGDSVGTFMEPIAKGVAARGHEVHVVAPWHPLVQRGAHEDGVHFHFYKYAPVDRLYVFGYAAAMRADVSLRFSAYAAAPLALAAGWWTARRVAHRCRATIMHGHWVVPGGVTAAAASRNAAGSGMLSTWTTTSWSGTSSFNPSHPIPTSAWTWWRAVPPLSID